MKRKVTIKYNWKRVDGKKEIDPQHQKALEESAMDRIIKMSERGYSCGELSDNIHMHDADPEDGIAYTGWWEFEHLRVK
jgi:hypothetical protein